MNKRCKNDRKSIQTTAFTTTKTSMHAAMKLLKLVHPAVKTFPRFLIKCSG